MASEIVALRVRANDPLLLARFWAGLLGGEVADDGDRGAGLLPAEDPGFPVRFVPTREPKTEKNRMHLDLTSTSLDDQQRTVARALALGARHIDVGQRPEEGHVVLADPEGDEFCVIEPGNAFLADCGFVGALACDGSPGVGHFWAAALGWPLVWDQDEETAVRSPRGGPKITWGPPLLPKAGENRLHVDLAPVDGDHRAEVDRLVALGAVRADPGRSGDGRTPMVDPDGNEFSLVERR